MRRILLTVLASAALCAAMPGHAGAQARVANGSMQSYVNVVWPPLTGTGVRPIQFGTVIPGAGAVTVRPSDARAAANGA